MFTTPPYCTVGPWTPLPHQCTVNNPCTGTQLTQGYCAAVGAPDCDPAGCAVAGELQLLWKGIGNWAHDQVTAIPIPPPSLSEYEAEVAFYRDIENLAANGGNRASDNTNSDCNLDDIDAQQAAVAARSSSVKLTFSFSAGFVSPLGDVLGQEVSFVLAVFDDDPSSTLQTITLPNGAGTAQLKYDETAPGALQLSFTRP